MQADTVDPDAGPVVVGSGHTTQETATAALVKTNSRTRSRSWPPGSFEAQERVLLQGRAAEQITSRLVFDIGARRGVVQFGPPP